MTAVLLAASISTDQKELLLQRWSREHLALGPHRQRNGELLAGDVVLRGAKQGYRLPTPGELGPMCANDKEPGGLFAIFDWASGEVVWQRSWRPMVMAPIGFCLSDGVLGRADEWCCAVSVIDVFDDPGRLLARISHPYLNDVHGVYRSSRGLLIASSGTDTIVELDVDGDLLYEWWAGGRSRVHRDDLRATEVRGPRAGASRSALSHPPPDDACQRGGIQGPGRALSARRPAEAEPDRADRSRSSAGRPAR